MPIQLRRGSASRSRRRRTGPSAGLLRALDLVVFHLSGQTRRTRRRWQLPEGLACLPERIAFLPDRVPLPPGRCGRGRDPFNVDRMGGPRFRVGSADRFCRAPGGLRRLFARLGAAGGRAGRLPDHTSPRVFAVILRATAMVALLSALAIWISMPGNLSPQRGLRFTEGTPTSQISAAGSVTEHVSASGPDAQASRSGSTQHGSAQATAAPTGVLPPTSPCHISYSVLSDVPSRFTVVIVIANTSTTKINGWSLHWDFPAKQKIVYGWNALVSNGQDGAVATDIDTDQVIEPGASVTLGFVGKREGWVPTPTGFTLNGQACQWQPTTALSTSSPGATAGVATTAAASATVSADSAVPAAVTASPTSSPILSTRSASRNGYGNNGNGGGTTPSATASTGG
jgi:hypothetical protein